MKTLDCNIVIGGEAGQGLVTVGTLLAKALIKSGFSTLVTQSYESRIRGGHNTFAIRFGTNDIKAPTELIDILIPFDLRTVEQHKQEMNPEGLIIVDEAAFDLNSKNLNNILKVPYKTLSPARYSNTVAFGVIASLLGLDKNLVLDTTHSFFGKKDLKAIEENEHALTKAYEWSLNQKTVLKKPELNPPPTPYMMMNGNEAIAVGAISSGLKFCSFYPMTPSTSISLSVIGLSKKAGVVVEQAEDEIAAINMAIGASFAGIPSMVATSGGGFALMVEGVSLAGMTETPLVIIVGQRPGPSTGLPTRTEQGDLLFVLHAGHGEFPKAIFAPGTPEECFNLTRKAFELAERYQGPIFILTDQFLADSYRSIPPFDTKDLLPIKIGTSATDNEHYNRYTITEEGVSPRLLPGMSKHLVVADSDEHTEDGHLTEDLLIRKKMVEKRLRKYNGLRSQVIPPKFTGDTKPDILFVSWGSNIGAVLEAAEKTRANGKTAATLHFSQVWPLVSTTFLDTLKNAKEVISVEGNATGQFAGLIRKETGFEIKKQVLRYDGLPITPKYILDNLG